MTAWFWEVFLFFLFFWGILFLFFSFISAYLMVSASNILQYFIFAFLILLFFSHFSLWPCHIFQCYIYIYIYIYISWLYIRIVCIRVPNSFLFFANYSPWEFFTSALDDILPLESEYSKSPQVSRTLLRSTVVWMASIRPPISNSSTLQLQLVSSSSSLSCSIVFLVLKQSLSSYLSFRFL